MKEILRQAIHQIGEVLICMGKGFQSQAENEERPMGLHEILFGGIKLTEILNELNSKLYNWRKEIIKANGQIRLRSIKDLTTKLDVKMSLHALRNFILIVYDPRQQCEKEITDFRYEIEKLIILLENICETPDINRLSTGSIEDYNY